MSEPTRPPNRPGPVQTAILLAIGWSAAGLGFLGVFLPLLPTTPFLLVAAFAFGRASPRAHRWLTTHRYLGPPLRDWQAHGAIAGPVKRMALLVMLASLGLSWAVAMPGPAIAVQAAILCAVAAFILSRPSAPDRALREPSE